MVLDDNSSNNMRQRQCSSMRQKPSSITGTVVQRRVSLCSNVSLQPSYFALKFVCQRPSHGL
eukprot:m.18470 g.18470  ORF g.18470 m.18470 type:complete len:62 (-) comp3595_c0_seq2:1530-1715(-)